MQPSKLFSLASLLLLSLPGMAQVPSLLVTGLDEGKTAHFEVGNCAQGDLVVIGYSFSGGGPLMGPLGSMQLSAPVDLFPFAYAGLLGSAGYDASVPFGTAGIAVWLQAANLSTLSLSNGVAVQIGSQVLTAEMVAIPAGSFAMGDHAGGGFPHETPVHDVALDGFLMDRFEVSIEAYLDFLNSAHSAGQIVISGSTVSQVGGAGSVLCETWTSSTFTKVTWDGQQFGVVAGYEKHPMVEVTWRGACVYANWRSVQDGFTECYDPASFTCDFGANGYRLPTEAEWEYAARGGASSYQLFGFGDLIDGSMANYKNSGDPFDNGTTPVGYYNGFQSPGGADMQNGFGLYDMAGNVWEWCGDLYSASYYGVSPGANPSGPSVGDDRVLRGGRWHGPSGACRSANRYHGVPTNTISTFGFRLVKR